MEESKNERIGNNVHDHVHYFPLFDLLGFKGNLMDGSVSHTDQQTLSSSRHLALPT